MSNNPNYLLFKVSVLEHVASNEACRIGEDILTVICEPPPASPLPAVTPTPTPTPNNNPDITFNNGMLIPGANNSIGSISGNGITLTGIGGSVLSYNTQTGSFTMSTLSLRNGNPSSFTELAKLVFIDAYMGSAFKITINGTTYLRTFTNGIIYL